jgi:hypothetical protein
MADQDRAEVLQHARLDIGRPRLQLPVAAECLLGHGEGARVLLEVAGARLPLQALGGQPGLVQRVEEGSRLDEVIDGIFGPEQPVQRLAEDEGARSMTCRYRCCSVSCSS